MLSSVLKSDRAGDVNVVIMRTFVRLRRILATNEDLARKVARHDQQIGVLFDQVQKMLAPGACPEESYGLQTAEGLIRIWSLRQPRPLRCGVPT